MEETEKFIQELFGLKEDLAECHAILDELGVPSITGWDEDEKVFPDGTISLKRRLQKLKEMIEKSGGLTGR